MHTLVVGIGNSLRGDDAVGPRVLKLLEDGEGSTLLASHALVPELAATIAGHARVVFIDADLRVSTVMLERIESDLSEGRPTTFGHHWSCEALVAYARQLGFRGDAWVCRIPVYTLEGEGLSGPAETAVSEAATLISALR